MKAAITPYGAACFAGSDTIRILCKADEARHIVHCVNNHERLVELLDKALGCMLVGIDNFSIEDREVYEDGCTLLATLEAEKGGGSNNQQY